ncbi:Hemolysin, chromosomal [Anatilimnocola aggregata]|uniref:Hemolysin, chromosomal n=1 Tax=Anatilimnocola aggregata TaxID=2528021 RepID=A0A517Y870_9BACT|nr:autotransporter-associated beta strand repeat-containing protein [Anatilimnocola aggregata]QDU26437.1 Hemolysin, chromosomal [Anatilimnocola aggregata]
MASDLSVARSLIGRKVRSGSTQTKLAARTKQRRLFLEALEDRRVMATVGEDQIFQFNGSELGLGSVVADFRDDYQTPTPKANWSYQWNSGGAIGTAANYANMVFGTSNYNNDDGIPGLPGTAPGSFVSINANGGHPGLGTNQATGGNNLNRYAITSFTVPTSGPYSITNSFVNRNNGVNELDVRVYVNDSLKSFAEQTTVNQPFNQSLGMLNVGDKVYVAVGPDGNDGNDSFALDYTLYGSAQITSVAALSSLGAAVSVAGGVVTYNPTAAANLQALHIGDSAADSVSVDYVLPNGTTGTAIVPITVLGADPTVLADSAATLANTVLSFDVLTNDTFTNRLIADYRDDFQGPTPKSGWAYKWNSTTTIGTTSGYANLIWTGTGAYDIDGIPGTPTAGPGQYTYFTATGVHPGIGYSTQTATNFDRYAIAEFTVPASGTYSITDSLFQHDDPAGTGVAVRVYVSTSATPLFSTNVSQATGSATFNTALGTLAAGTKVYVAIGPDTSHNNDRSFIDFSIRASSTPTLTAVDTLSTYGAALALDGANNVSYNPTNSLKAKALVAGQTLVDTFTYNITEAGVGTATGTASVTLTGVGAFEVDLNAVGAPGNDLAADEITLRLSADGLMRQIYINDVLLNEVPVSDTSPLTIAGSSDDDTLTIDMNNGNPIPTSGISFDGGVGGNDSMVVTGGSTTTVTHTFNNASDGRIVLAGPIAGTINYSGLEPVDQDISTEFAEFIFLGAAETITVTDETANDGQMRIDSDLFGELTDFNIPSARLTIRTSTGAAGADTLTFDSVDAQFRASIEMFTDNNDIVNLNAPLTLGNTIAEGNVIVAAASLVNLNANINTDAGTATGGGDIQISAPVALAANVTLDTDRPTGTDGTISFGATANLGSNELTLNAGTANYTMSTVISGTGSLRKLGSGTLTLNGSSANTLSGTTVVNAGILHLAKTSGNAIGGDLTIATSGKVTFGASNQIVDTATVSMSGSGSVLNGNAINGGQFNVTETIANLTITGGAFNPASDGVWTITGTGSFTGGAGNTIFVGNSGTRLSFGTLQIKDMLAVAGSTVTTANSFTLYGNNSTRQSTITVGAGGLILDGSSLNIRLGSSANTKGSRLIVNGGISTTGSTASFISEDTAGGTLGAIAVELSNSVGAVTRNFTIAGGGANLTVGVPITNGMATPGGITKIGTGNLTLARTNTYSGLTTITEGILHVGSAGTTGTLGSGAVVNDATLAFNRTDTHLVSNNISGSGSLNQAGSGTIVLTGANTYGATNITAGTLQVGNAGTVGTLGTGDVSNAGTLAFNRSDAITIGNNITGAGIINQIGAGTTELTGTNSANTTNVTAGRLNVNGELTSTVVVSGSGVLGGNGTIIGSVSSTGSAAQVNPGNSPGTLTVTGNYSANSTFEINDDYLTPGVGGDYDQIIVNGAANTINLAAALVTFVSAGGGTAPALPNLITLIENNTSNPITPFSNLAQGSVVTLGTGGAARSFIASYTGGDGNDLVLFNATVPNNIIYIDDSFVGTVGQPVNDADKGTIGDEVAILGGNAFTTFAAAQLAHPSFGGTFIVNDGNYNEAVVLANTQILEVTGPDAPQTVVIASLAVAGTQSITIEGTSNLTIGNASTTEIAGVISGSGSLTKQGAGTVTLGAANTYSGVTSITQGVLLVNGSLSNSTDVAVSAGATYQLGASDTIDGLTGAGTVTLGGNTLTVGGNNEATPSFGGAIGGTGGLTKIGSGNQTLSGPNSYTGATTISTGTLSVTGSLSNLTDVSVASLATYSVEGTDTINALTGTGTVSLGAGFTLTVGGANQVTSWSFGGLITGSGSFSKTGAGTQILTSANDYTGSTTVGAGILRISNATALGGIGAASGTTVSNGARLELAGGITVNGEALTISGSGTNNIGALQSESGANTWAGTVLLGADSTRIGANGSGDILTISGVIDDGTSSFTLAIRNADAGGTVVLSGVNTYGGNTDVVVGLVQIAGGNDRLPVGTALRVGNAANVSAARFDLNGFNQTVGGLVSVGTTMAKTLDNSGASATLTVNNSSANTYLGRIVGNLSLTKIGSGELVLAGNTANGANTATGLTTVSAGTLTLSKPAGVDAIAGNILINGGTLQLAATDQIINTSAISLSSGNLNFYSGFTAYNETFASLAMTGGNLNTAPASNANDVTVTGLASVSAGNFTINSGTHFSANSLTFTGGTNTVWSNSTIRESRLIVGAGGLSMTGSTLTLLQGTAAGALGSRLLLNGDVTTLASAVSASIVQDVVGAPTALPHINLGGVNRTFTVADGAAAVDLILGVVIENGSLIKSGAGTQLLSNSNTYTGTTQVNAGTLQLQGGTAILDTAGVVTVAAGATLELLADETVSSFVGIDDPANETDGLLALGANRLTTTGDATIANVSASAGARIVAQGAIIDGDLDNNITGPNIFLQAATGIGSSGANGAIETAVSNIQLFNSTSGAISVLNSNMGALLTVSDLHLLGFGANNDGGSTTIVNSSPLTIASDSISLGDVVFTASDSAAVGDNLTVNSGVTVQSTGGSVTLNAGDDALLDGDVTAATQVTVNVDAGDGESNGVGEVAPGSGGTVTINGVITVNGGTGTTFLNGGDDYDTFDFDPQTTTSFSVNGNAPHGTADGDRLVITVPALTVQTVSDVGSGGFSFAPTANPALDPVTYVSIEEQDVTGGPLNLLIDLTPVYNGVNNQLTMQRVGADLVINRLGTGPVTGNFYTGTLATINSLEIRGGGQNDSVEVFDTGTGLPDFVGTVPGVTNNPNVVGTPEFLFTGGAGTDVLTFNLGLASTAQVYGIGSGSGTAANDGEISTTNPANTLITYFTSVSEVNRAGFNATADGLQILGDLSGNTINTTDNGGGETRVQPTGYTPFDFSGDNFSSFEVYGLRGSDTLTLTSFGSGQTNNPTIVLDGSNPTGFGGPTDDGLADTLRVLSTSSNTGLVTLLGGLGSDQFFLAGPGLTVDDIAGPVVVDGEDNNLAGNNDQLFIDDSGDTTADPNVLIAAAGGMNADYAVTGINASGVTFRNIDSFDYTGTEQGDTIDGRFTPTNVPHDLNTVALRGFDGDDQFLLFTSNQWGGVTPVTELPFTRVASGVGTISLYGNDGEDIFGETPAPVIGNTGAMHVGLAVPATTRLIRPTTAATAGGSTIFIDGGDPVPALNQAGDTVGDVLNLDVTDVPKNTAMIVGAGSSGNVLSANTAPFSWVSIEDLNLVDNGKLTGVQIGDVFGRGTTGNDLMQISANATAALPHQVRVRIGGAIMNYNVPGKAVLYGGNGVDTMSQTTAKIPAVFYGEAGNDSLAGGSNNDWLVGGDGNDQITGGEGQNVIWGDNAPTNPGDPTPQDFQGLNDGNDTISSGNGADVIYAGGGHDVVNSGGGNDYIHAGAGNDSVDAGAGDDRVYGYSGNDTLQGNSGNDLLSGGDGNDWLLGHSGNNVLIGGTGSDTLSGGDGNDLLITGGLGGEENSTWTSAPNTMTYAANTYSDPMDNDAALLALLTAWQLNSNAAAPPPEVLALLPIIAPDGSDDDAWGGNGSDLFSWDAADMADESLTAPGPNDFNNPATGPDVRLI